MSGHGAQHIRPLRAGDRASVDRIVRATGNFTPVEIATAIELVDDWLERGEASGYLCYVLDTGTAGRVDGFVTFGPTPLTEGTFDLYWIAVEPAVQKRGAGQTLLRFAEGEVRRQGGRLLLIETSSHETYGATARFYERAGYGLVARIPDFYRPGDDKLVFAKRLQAG